jgi:RNA polymerase sigma-70 factor (ECF subfamily)
MERTASLVSPPPFDLELLVRATRPALVRFLSRLFGPADAEDVAQITLVNAARGLGAFRGESSPRTWLFRIAANAARDWKRANPSSIADAAEPADADEEPAEATEDASQERRLVREQTSGCVGEHLRRLPESYQAVLALSDCEELPDREIAEVLGVTVGAAKVRLHRARTRLKAELERGCSFYRDEQGVFCCDRKGSSTSAAKGSPARD